MNEFFLYYMHVFTFPGIDDNTKMHPVGSFISLQHKKLKCNAFRFETVHSVPDFTIFDVYH